MRWYNSVRMEKGGRRRGLKGDQQGCRMTFTDPAQTLCLLDTLA